MKRLTLSEITNLAEIVGTIVAGDAEA